MLPMQVAIMRFFSSVLFNQNDRWYAQYHYMKVEAFNLIDTVKIEPKGITATKPPDQNLGRFSKLDQLDGRNRQFSNQFIIYVNKF
jgi:hypothetical protein